MFMHCVAIIWIAFDRVLIACMSTMLKRLDATTKTHATNARHCATHTKTHERLRNSKCCKVLVPIVKGA